jgi:hypothetical protein
VHEINQQKIREAGTADYVVSCSGMSPSAVSEIVRADPFGRAYSWEIPLRKPMIPDALLSPETMTAAEQMFFLGAPLAHVVEFEKRLRVRRAGEARTAGRLTRIVIRAAAREAVLAG